MARRDPAFPGRDVFEWALVLPLAVPTYVIGFVFVALFEFAGPVPTFFRETLNLSWRFPNVRSYGGVVLAMSLVSCIRTSICSP